LTAGLDKSAAANMGLAERQEQILRQLELLERTVGAIESRVVARAGVPARREAGPIVFMFVVNGPAIESGRGCDDGSTWVGFDKSYVKRRDGLARCIAAAFWKASLGWGPDDTNLAIPQSRCCLVFEEECCAVTLEAEPFVAHCKQATEFAILNTLERAIQGTVPGCSIVRAPSVQALASKLFSQFDAAKFRVVQLHESFDKLIPVAETPSAARPPQCETTPIILLGCVEDHVETIKTLLDEARAASLPVQQANLGPVAEFSSKCVDIIMSHHCCNRLVPALLLQQEDLLGCQVPEQHVVIKPPALHAWVWLPHCTVDHLPTAEETKAQNPKLTQAAREKSWVVARLCLAGILKSHGSYEKARLSLVLGSTHTTLTLGKSLCTKHLTARKWGAATEHHVLTAVRDAIDDSQLRTAATLAASLECFLVPLPDSCATVPGLMKLVIIVDAKSPNVLPLYGKQCAAPQSKQRSTVSQVHVMVVSPGSGLDWSSTIQASLLSASSKVGVVICSLPGELAGDDAGWNPVRLITSIQGCNNCNALVPAAMELFIQQGQERVGEQQQWRNEQREQDQQEQDQQEPPLTRASAVGAERPCGHGDGVCEQCTRRRKGDWLCGACKNLNFGSRTVCPRCSHPKGAPAPPSNGDHSGELPARVRSDKNTRRKGKGSDKVPVTTLFVSGLERDTRPAGLKLAIHDALTAASAQGGDKPAHIAKVKLGVNSDNHTAGFGWFGVKGEEAVERMLAVSGQVEVRGHTLAVSRCSEDGARDVLFPYLTYQQRLALQFDRAVSESVCNQYNADRLTKIALEVAAASGSVGDVTCARSQLPSVLDAFACVGGSAVSFAQAGARVVAVEVDPTRLSMLQHNVQVVLGEQASLVTCLLGDSAALMQSRQAHADICFMDTMVAGHSEQWADSHSLRAVVSEAARMGTDMVVLRLSSKAEVDQLARWFVDPDSGLCGDAGGVNNDRPFPFTMRLGHKASLFIACLPSSRRCIDPVVQHRLPFGLGNLDRTIGVLQRLDNTLLQELHPRFFDWECSKWVRLKTWKGVSAPAPV
jgi:hypothetical protein